MKLSKKKGLFTVGLANAFGVSCNTKINSYTGRTGDFV